MIVKLFKINASNYLPRSRITSITTTSFNIFIYIITKTSKASNNLDNLVHIFLACCVQISSIAKCIIIYNKKNKGKFSYLTSFSASKSQLY